MSTPANKIKTAPRSTLTMEELRDGIEKTYNYYLKECQQ